MESIIVCLPWKTSMYNREATVLCLKMTPKHPWLHATIGQFHNRQRQGMRSEWMANPRKKTVLSKSSSYFHLHFSVPVTVLNSSLSRIPLFLYIQISHFIFAVGLSSLSIFRTFSHFAEPLLNHWSVFAKWGYNLRVATTKYMLFWQTRSKWHKKFINQDEVHYLWDVRYIDRGRLQSTKTTF